MRRFWSWAKNEQEERTLYLNGIIAGNGTWYGDNVTPAAFKEELHGSGENSPVTVWIDSPGGDVFAAAEIYNALKEYKGHVTIKIGSIAASAASVIAMAGDVVLISPVGQIMIHNPWTFSIGDSEEMRRAAEMLDSVKESIINAYQLKTGLSRTVISHLMDDDKYMDANEAIEKGFCDGMLFSEEDGIRDSVAAIFNCPADISKITRALSLSQPFEGSKETSGTPVDLLKRRLDLLSITQ